MAKKKTLYGLHCTLIGPCHRTLCMHAALKIQEAKLHVPNVYHPVFDGGHCSSDIEI
jgi:hypothetical protein